MDDNKLSEQKKATLRYLKKATEICHLSIMNGLQRTRPFNQGMEYGTRICQGDWTWIYNLFEEQYLTHYEYNSVQCQRLSG